MRPRVVVTYALLLLLAGVVAYLTGGQDNWDLARLGVIATFTLVSGVTYVVIESANINLSGSFLGVIMAAVMLGGAPAAVIGVAGNFLVRLRSRESPEAFANNTVVHAWFPLLSGLFFRSVAGAFHITQSDPAFYLLTFAAFGLGLAVNFAGIAAFQCLRRGTSLFPFVREALVPVLPAELFSALLTVAAVWVSIHTGPVGTALLGLLLLLFQYLLGELLRSQERGKELQRRATTDELTSLANRERFRDRLREEIGRAGEGRACFPVMLLDLDRFKEINDTLGHHYGDELLRQLGPRLAECVGEGGLVARLGGDEFAILPGMWTDDPEMLERKAAEIAAAVELPLSIDEMTVEVGASIGISLYPRDGEDAHGLLRSADVAMYAAKEAHIPSKVYEAGLDRNSVGRLNVLSEFRRALVSDQVVVHFQPIVDLDGTHLRGAEGLVRWEHPTRGLLAPGAFMNAVEQTGLIGPLTQHVLEHAIAECAGWRRGGENLSVAVNLSVRNLLDRCLPREVERLLSLYALPPAALKLEITESMIMTDPERALTVVIALNDLGVRLSVDDFGTGYSSLANLRRMPISELKIDRSFVSPMLRDESDLIIVRSTINLGHDLGLRVIAEGVEDLETLQSLETMGCDFAQGYHISRPLAADSFARWMAGERAGRPQNIEVWGEASGASPSVAAATGARHSGPS